MTTGLSLGYGRRYPRALILMRWQQYTILLAHRNMTLMLGSWSVQPRYLYTHNGGTHYAAILMVSGSNDCQLARVPPQSLIPLRRVVLAYWSLRREVFCSKAVACLDCSGFLCVGIMHNRIGPIVGGNRLR